jgi:hypothetical protein
MWLSVDAAGRPLRGAGLVPGQALIYTTTGKVATHDMELIGQPLPVE